jgi:hypothetical protein
MKFYVKDIPNQWPVFQYMAAKTNLKEHLLKSRFNVTDLISLEHKFDLNSIKESVLEILKITEPKGWLTAGGRSKPYTGISLVYNPNLQEDIDPNYQTLGTAYNTKDEFFWKSTNKVPHLKNSYFDTYSFRKISPAITGKLLDMISAFDAPIIRSRIGIVDANETVLSEVDKQGWHKDEPVFENLRINIPITTDEDCLFQIEGNEPEHLPYGNVYTWDTYIPHRVFASKIKPTARIHIVLGFSPWFNYNQEDDSWETNEFFGKKHPIDMLVDGELCSLIKGIKQ